MIRGEWCIATRHKEQVHSNISDGYCAGVLHSNIKAGYNGAMIAQGLHGDQEQQI